MSNARNEMNAEQAPSKEISDKISNSSVKEDGNTKNKMISEYQISKQSNSLKKDYDKIENLVSGVQGWIVSSNLNLPTTNYDYSFAYLTLNIPIEHVSDFLDVLNKIGKTNNISIEQHDISDEYIDNESRIKSLEAEETALLQLLEKSESVSDMITIQERLSTVRSEREKLTTNNQTLDTQVNYTKIEVNIEEIATNKPQNSENFWEQVKKSWKNQKNSIKQLAENLLIFTLSYALYFVVIIGVIILIKVKLNQKKTHEK